MIRKRGYAGQKEGKKPKPKQTLMAVTSPDFREEETKIQEYHDFPELQN